MGALVAVGGIDAGSDKSDLGGAAGAPVSGAIGAVEGIDVGFEIDTGAGGDGAEVIGQAFAVRAAGVFDAEGAVVFVAVLSFADASHVEDEHFLEVGGEGVHAAVTDFFKVADQDVGALGGADAGVGEGFDGGEGAGDASFVIKEAGADESAGSGFEAGVEVDEVADIDAEVAGLFGRGGSFVDSDFERVGVAGFGRGVFVDVDSAVGEDDGATEAVSGAGHDGDTFGFDGRPHDAVEGGHFEATVGFDLGDDGTEGVDVGGEGAGFVVAEALEVGDEGAFGGVDGGDAHALEFLFDKADGPFGVAGGAGGVDEIFQRAEEIIRRDVKPGHEAGCTSRPGFFRLRLWPGFSFGGGGPGGRGRRGSWVRGRLRGRLRRGRDGFLGLRFGSSGRRGGFLGRVRLGGRGRRGRGRYR